MTPVVITVIGTPRTKKTSNVLATPGGQQVADARRVRVLPSKEWVRWVKQALILHQLDAFDTPSKTREGVFVGLQPLVRERVNCRAHFYLTRAQHGDAVGYYQGLADLLQKRGVLENDRLIGAWDGSELFVDQIRPRVEIVFTARPKGEAPADA